MNAALRAQALCAYALRAYALRAYARRAQATRAYAILVDPVATWRRIDEEAADPAYLLAHYVALFALIPAVSGFVGACLIGVVVPRAGPVRQSIIDGLFGATFGYAAAFAIVLLVGLWIAILAPRFGGRRDFTRAFALAVYSFTPVWLSGVFLLLPGLRFLELTGCYGAYILVKGLPVLVGSRAQRSRPFAAATVVFAAALTLLAAAAQHALFARPGM